MLHRWDDVPPRVRRVVLGLALVLTYGTAVHLVQLLASGGDPHPALPGWLRVYFVSLTLLDPLAAALLLLRRRSGVAAAAAVLVTDAVANGWANHVLDPTAGITAGRVGQAVVSALALAALVTAPLLWRHAAPRR